MPRFDKTGPMGAGPGTGCGRGDCFEGNNPRGFKRGGRGFGRRPRCMDDVNLYRPSKEDLLNEKELLSQRLALVEAELAKQKD